MKKHDLPPEKKGPITRVLTLLMAVCIVLALLCLALPTARKKEMLRTYGQDLENELALVPAMISYYDGSYISVLAANPAENTAYRDASDALSALRVAGGFDSIILVVRQDKQYLCAADGAYGSDAGAYSAGSLLSLEKPVTRVLDDVFDGEEGGTVSDLTAARGGGDAVCVVLPVVGSDGAVSAALAVQYGVGETQHHMLLGINLYAAFGVFLAIALVLGLLLYLGRKLHRGKTPPEGGDFPPASDGIDFPPKKPAPPAPEKKKEEEKPADDILSADDPIPVLELLDEDDEDAEK